MPGTRIDRHDFQCLHKKLRSAVLCICVHGDHYHVVHDCTYHNYTCRCYAIDRIKSFKSFGSISQSISRRKDDISYNWTLPGELGYQVVKFDIYNFNKISKMDKKNWWKEAEIRSTFLTSSPLDRKAIMVQKLMKEVIQGIQKIPNLQKEEKRIGSYPFYGNTQYRQ